MNLMTKNKKDIDLIFQPNLARIEKILPQIRDHRLFQLKFIDENEFKIVSDFEVEKNLEQVNKRILGQEQEESKSTGDDSLEDAFMNKFKKFLE